MKETAELLDAMRDAGVGSEYASAGKTAVSGFGILRTSKTDPFRGPEKHPALKTRLDFAFRGGQVNIAGPPEN
jgi:hypothetical protein